MKEKRNSFQSSANAISYKVNGAFEGPNEYLDLKFQSSANAISYKANDSCNDIHDIDYGFNPLRMQ